MSKNLLLTLLTMVVVWKCAPTDVSSGGGASETVATVAPYEKGVRISVRNDDQFAVVAKIYNKKFSRFDTGWFRDSTVLSDSRPEWLLPGLPESTLHVFVIDSVNGTAAFFRYDSGGSFSGSEKKLTPTGSVAGEVSVVAEDGTSEPAIGYWVLIPGSPFETPTGSDGSYRLSGIPEGKYVIEARNDQKTYKRDVDSITVEIEKDQMAQQDITM